VEVATWFRRDRDDGPVSVTAAKGLADIHERVLHRNRVYLSQSLHQARPCTAERARKFSSILRIRNNLAIHVDAIVGTVMIISVSNKDVRSIPNAALKIDVVLAGAPLPDHSIVNVSFAGRMVVAPGSTGDNRDRVLIVCDASEPATELGVDVVGKVLISDLCGEGAKLPRVQAQETFVMIRTRGSP